MHTRYTHSIGVMHIAGEMAQHINMNMGINPPFFSDNDIQIIRLTGLLHDIGHYPMSHNVEQAYKDANNVLKIKRGYELKLAERLKDLTKCPDFLNPILDDKVGVKPKATFKTTEKVVAAFEDCNLHGLWKADV